MNHTQFRTVEELHNALTSSLGDVSQAVAEQNATEVQSAIATLYQARYQALAKGTKLLESALLWATCTEGMPVEEVGEIWARIDELSSQLQALVAREMTLQQPLLYALSSANRAVQGAKQTFSNRKPTTAQLK